MNKLIVNNCQLDENQQKAVEDNTHNILVIAGAGAGKTLTILGKVKYLKEVLNYKDQEILCISYTNETTKELQKKLRDLNCTSPVKTFHKLAMDILKVNDAEIMIAEDNYLEKIIDTFLCESIHKLPYLKKIFLKHFKCKFVSILTKKRYEKTLLKQKSYFIKEFSHLIHRFKTQGKTTKDLKNILFNTKEERSSLIIFYAIYLYYETSLNVNFLYDFNDLIIASTQKIEQMNSTYKYVIVDEYQDISLIRNSLLQALIYKTKAKLMVVGDDWQSIYAFSGSSIDVFLNFSKNYFNVSTYTINNTYRNCQQLINAAGYFIMKNSNQISKMLKSTKSINKPFKIVFYKNKTQDFIKLLKLVSSHGNCLVLGRNNFDIYRYLDRQQINKDNYIIIENKVVARFLTIHKSKGLESNNVILINLESNLYGFPNLKKCSKLSKIILNIDDKQNLLEERRLFYVALTRSKNNVYFYLNKYNISSFIKELMYDYPKLFERISISDNKTNYKVKK